MVTIPRLQTDRLVLRALRAEDLDPYAAMQSDPRFDPRSRVLADYRQTTSIRMSATEVDQLASFARFYADTKRALLVSPGFVAGITALFASAYQSGNVKLFTDRAATLQWLNDGVAPEKALA